MIDEMGPRYSALLGNLHDDETEVARGMLKKSGSVIYELPPADMEKVGAIVAPMWEEWISEKEAKGFPAKKIVADLYTILRDMGVSNPFHGYTP